MAGKVPKAALSANPESLRLDAEASAIISRLVDRGDTFQDEFHHVLD